jgi:hypothetical protein
MLPHMRSDMSLAASSALGQAQLAASIHNHDAGQLLEVPTTAVTAAAGCGSPGAVTGWLQLQVGHAAPSQAGDGVLGS